MKDRIFKCKYYVKAHECSKGRDCLLNRDMQKCQLYEPDLNSNPIIINNKKKKLQKIKNKEFKKERW